jgi:hypothetical protein
MDHDDTAEPQADDEAVLAALEDDLAAVEAAIERLEALELAGDDLDVAAAVAEAVPHDRFPAVAGPPDPGADPGAGADGAVGGLAGDAVRD